MEDSGMRTFTCKISPLVKKLRLPLVVQIERTPAIYGDRIVWALSGNAVIYIYNISTSTETKISDSCVRVFLLSTWTG